VCTASIQLQRHPHTHTRHTTLSKPSKIPIVIVWSRRENPKPKHFFALYWRPRSRGRTLEKRLLAMYITIDYPMSIARTNYHPSHLLLAERKDFSDSCVQIYNCVTAKAHRHLTATKPGRCNVRAHVIGRRELTVMSGQRLDWSCFV
jgi:hypothetical protein